VAHRHDFFLPEDHLNVKVVFDNIRNYAVSGAFLAFAILLERRTWRAPSFAEGDYWDLLVSSMPAISAAVGVTLFLTNFVQTVLIFFRTIDALIKTLEGIARWAEDGRRSGWITNPLIFTLLMIPVLLFIFFGAAVVVVLYLMMLAASGLHAL
jgi:hypothetical protein